MQELQDKREIIDLDNVYLHLLPSIEEKGILPQYIENILLSLERKFFLTVCTGDYGDVVEHKASASLPLATSFSTANASDGKQNDLSSTLTIYRISSTYRLNYENCPILLLTVDDEPIGILKSIHEASSKLKFKPYVVLEAVMGNRKLNRLFKMKWLDMASKDEIEAAESESWESVENILHASKPPLDNTGTRKTNRVLTSTSKFTYNDVFELDNVSYYRNSEENGVITTAAMRENFRKWDAQLSRSYFGVSLVSYCDRHDLIMDYFLADVPNMISRDSLNFNASASLDVTTDNYTAEASHKVYSCDLKSDSKTLTTSAPAPHLDHDAIGECVAGVFYQQFVTDIKRKQARPGKILKAALWNSRTKSYRVTNVCCLGVPVLLNNSAMDSNDYITADGNYSNVQTTEEVIYVYDGILVDRISLHMSLLEQEDNFLQLWNDWKKSTPKEDDMNSSDKRISKNFNDKNEYYDIVDKQAVALIEGRYCAQWTYQEIERLTFYVSQHLVAPNLLYCSKKLSQLYPHRTSKDVINLYFTYLCPMPKKNTFRKIFNIYYIADYLRSNTINKENNVDMCITLASNTIDLTAYVNQLLIPLEVSIQENSNENTNIASHQSIGDIQNDQKCEQAKKEFDDDDMYSSGDERCFDCHLAYDELEQDVATIKTENQMPEVI